MAKYLKKLGKGLGGYVKEEGPFAVIGGLVAQDALVQQQKSICDQTKQLKDKYQSYYNEAYDYISNKAQASQKLMKETNAVKAEIEAYKNKLVQIQEDTDYQQLLCNIFLSIIFVIVAFVLYIKYTGLLETDEFDEFGDI